MKRDLVNEICEALGMLNWKEIPAVVFYDNHSSTLLAESITRFMRRSDCCSDRYSVLIRVEEEYLRYLKDMALQGQPGVIDITQSFRPEIVTLFQR